MLRSIPLGLLVCVALASPARAQLAGDYTIGGDEPDYASFGAAITALEAQGVAGPVTFHVRAGTYTEDGGQATVIDVGSIAGVSENARVVFQPDAATGAGVDDVVLERSGGGGVSVSGYIARIDSDYVTLRDLTLREAAPGTDRTSDIFVAILASSGERRGVEVVGCVIESRNRARFVISFSGGFRRFYDLRIAGNRIHDFVDGIFLSANNSNQFWDATIEGNRLTGMRYDPANLGRGTGIRSDAYNVRLAIRDNLLDYAGGGLGLRGIGVSGPAFDVEVAGNRVVNVRTNSVNGFGAGIEVGNSQSGGRVVNNMVSIDAPRRRGVVVRGDGGVRIAHNSVYMPARGIDIFGGSRALEVCGSNLTVIGNLLVERGELNNVYALSTCGTGEENNVFDGNLLYSAGGALVRDGNVDVPTLAVWQARGNGAGSVSKLPEIVDPYGDLHLTGCSAADPELRTVPLDVASTDTDIDGDPRSPLAAVMGADQPPAEALVQPFGQSQLLTVGTGPRSERVFDIAAGDFDGDGDQDLAVALVDDIDSGGSLEWIENLGGGRFGPPNKLVSLAVGRHLFVRAGDVDADGAVDLVAVAEPLGPEEAFLFIHWGVGDGSFLPAERVFVPGIFSPVTAYRGSVWDLELGDLDLDGDLDIVALLSQDEAVRTAVDVLCYDDDRVFAGGDGESGRDPSMFRFDATLGDLDGDGDLDLVSDYDAFENPFGGCTLANKGQVLAGIDTTPLSPALAVADVDGDGDGDVLADLRDASAFEDSISLRRSNGDFSFAPSERILVESFQERRPGPLTTLDYEGDGDPDVYVGNRYPSPPDNLTTGAGVLLRNDGSGTFTRTLACGESQLPTQPGKLLATDLDGDGLEDVVALVYVDETIAWIRNASAGLAPVAIESFGATLNGASVALAWSTPSEQNNAGFEVERRTGDTSTWQRIGIVPGAGTTAEPQQYALDDDALPAADSLAYRLLQVDVSGAVAIGPEVVVDRPDCANGVDDDGDGFADAGDPGCADAADASERDARFACDDGLDNDGDGFADHPNDPGCAFVYSSPEDPPCDDGLDNDTDGLVDLDDPSCSASWPYWECGLGAELVPALAALRLLRRRRAARAPRGSRLREALPSRVMLAADESVVRSRERISDSGH